MHPTVLAQWGLPAYAALAVTGTRITAVLAALSPPRSRQDVIYLDSLTCLNAGVSEGSWVECRPISAPTADRIVLTFPPEVTNPEPRALATVLSGKVLTEGDRVSLLPQDYVRPPRAGPGPDPMSVTEAIRTLLGALGEKWKQMDVVVAGVHPGPTAVATDQTTVVVARQSLNDATAMPVVPRLEDLGGIGPQARLLEEWLSVSFAGGPLLARMGFRPPDGVLVSGPAGCGKSSLVAAMAAHLGAGLTVMYGTHLASWNPADAARYLQTVLGRVYAPPPQIVLFEDIDKVLPHPSGEACPSALGPVLLDQLRAVNARPQVALVATTRDRSNIDPSVIGPGLFENELEIPVPRKEERFEILAVHTRSMPLAEDVSLSDIAERTAGFVGADLRLLCQKAAARSLWNGPDRTREAGRIFHRDFLAALAEVRPSAVTDRQVELGGVRFEDVGDLDDVKAVLEEIVLWPLRFPETMRRYGLKAPKGILLYGPPGCGKTFIMKALANEASASFFVVRGPELLSKWVGESERAIRDLFRKAEAAAPSILLLDEIDSLAPMRGRGVETSTDRVVGQLLSLLDGLVETEEVWVVGATNRPDMVDPALLRPGRLERLVYVGPPGKEARLAILSVLTRHLPLGDDVDLHSLAERTQGYSSADLEALVRNAMVASVKQTPEEPVLSSAHLRQALAATPPSLRPELLAQYAAFGAP